MLEVELERTYLVKELPKDLGYYSHKEIVDIYIPKEVEHPVVRIRKNGDRFELTKKVPIKGVDSSEQSEHTVRLSEEEFNALANVVGKRVRKIRYSYSYNGVKAEIDIFQDDLLGLVMVDFEFNDVKEKNSFKMPDFCLVDVTQEKTFAGGMLCGKKYLDIEPRLNDFKYSKLQNNG